jgi:hypothetical protein
MCLALIPVCAVERRKQLAGRLALPFPCLFDTTLRQGFDQFKVKLGSIPSEALGEGY